MPNVTFVAFFVVCHGRVTTGTGMTGVHAGGTGGITIGHVGRTNGLLTRGGGSTFCSRILGTL